MKTTDNQDELFVVVDKNDNIIDYRSRRDCHSDKSLIHRSASVVIYNSKGEILLQKRSKTKDLFPGYYTLSASGHVQKGESYLDAAKREMLEEIGVKTELTFVKKFLLSVYYETELVALFTATHDGPFNPNKDEVEDVLFVLPSSLKGMENTLTPAAFEDLKQLEII